MDVHIKIIEAKLKKEPDYSEKQDPYITFSWQGEIFKTKTVENASQYPVWIEDFEIKEVEEEDSIFFECYVATHDGN